MNNLTPKQEGFCISYIETGNASEAYRLNYSASKMSQAALKIEACKLLKHPNIALTLESLKKAHSERHNITVDTLTDELNEAFNVAKEDIKPSAMVAAIMGKAKLHGLLTDKVEVAESSIASRLAAARKLRNG